MVGCQPSAVLPVLTPWPSLPSIIDHPMGKWHHRSPEGDHFGSVEGDEQVPEAEPPVLRAGSWHCHLEWLLWRYDASDAGTH